MDNFALQLALFFVFLTLGMSFIYPIKEIDKPYKVIIFLILLNLLLTIFSPNFSLINLLSLESNLVIKENSTSEFWAMRGQIGDLIAGHFTALAFIGILINITQMRRSLDKQDEAIKIQQKEMQNQQDEMRATTKSLELQAKLIEKQNFENTFFKMLDLYINIQNNIRFKDNDKKIEKNGDEAFLKYSEFWSVPDLENLLLKDFNEININFIKKNHIYLSHYFRTLYRIIKFVHLYTDIYNQIDKKEYIKLIRAQLSSIHLFIIFCNCLHVRGSNLKKLAEEYAIFEHLEPMQLFTRWDVNIIKLFDISAFGNGILSNIENQEKSFYVGTNETVE